MAATFSIGQRGSPSELPVGSVWLHSPCSKVRHVLLIDHDINIYSLGGRAHQQISDTHGRLVALFLRVYSLESTATIGQRHKMTIDSWDPVFSRRLKSSNLMSTLFQGHLGNSQNFPALGIPPHVESPRLGISQFARTHPARASSLRRTHGPSRRLFRKASSMKCIKLALLHPCACSIYYRYSYSSLSCDNMYVAFDSVMPSTYKKESRIQWYQHEVQPWVEFLGLGSCLPYVLAGGIYLMMVVVFFCSVRASGGKTFTETSLLSFFCYVATLFIGDFPSAWVDVTRFFFLFAINKKYAACRVVSCAQKSKTFFLCILWNGESALGFGRAFFAFVRTYVMVFSLFLCFDWHVLWP